jgi:ribosome-binding factor A
MDRSRNKTTQKKYPRSARVNALLQEILAEELERFADRDERLVLCTVTGVSCDPDLRHALVFFSSLKDDVIEALEEHRRALQSAIASQVRMKRVPALKFVVDPAIVAGTRVEEALRRARDAERKEPGQNEPDTVESLTREKDS